MVEEQRPQQQQETRKSGFEMVVAMLRCSLLLLLGVTMGSAEKLNAVKEHAWTRDRLCRHQSRLPGLSYGKSRNIELGGLTLAFVRVMVRARGWLRVRPM